MSDFETVPVGTMERLTQVAAERDALAAHVELLEDAALGAVRFIPSDDPSMIKISDAVDTNPTTSLARRIAQAKAEALEEEAALGTYHTIHSRDEMTDHAAAYRRQAEEDVQ